MRPSLIVVVLLPLALLGCGEQGPSTTPDATKKILPDLGAPPDLGQKLPCASEWQDAIHAQRKVSTGIVSSTEQAGGEKVTTVDATAGGMQAAFSNPYVYLSLDNGGARVELDDFQAQTSTAWDLALRRAVIRVNGGDSGVGQGAVAILPGKKLSEITAVPAESLFATDDFLDANCRIRVNQINDIWTAFGGSTGIWYSFDTGTMKLTPNPEAYVIRTAKGKHVKLVVESYYKESTGASYTLRWTTL